MSKGCGAGSRLVMAAAVLLVGFLACAHAFSTPSGLAPGRFGALGGLGEARQMLACGSATRGLRAAGVSLVRMQETEKKSGAGANIGKGLADFGRAIDELATDDDDDEAAKEAAKKKSSKDVLFGGREQKINEGAEKDLEGMEAGDLAPLSDEPIPEPIIYKKQDFVNTVWKIQVEKNGNWFSGNYAPDTFYVALGEEEKCEFGGDPLTMGKWYMDSGSIYIERRPFGALGPLGPGKEYYRCSLTGWATDDLLFQAAGVVSGYSPLFPVAILGRCLMTREKAADEAYVRKKIVAAASKVGGATKKLPGTTTKNKKVSKMTSRTT